VSSTVGDNPDGETAAADVVPADLADLEDEFASKFDTRSLQVGDLPFVPAHKAPLGVGLKPFSDPWWSYAYGYRRAARMLFEAMRQEQGNPTTLLYPLAFLWRHYVEVKLKAILPELRFLTDDPEAGVPVSHKLDMLWEKAKRLLLGADPGSRELVDIVEVVIQQLAKVDPRGEAFCYPVYNDGTATLPPDCLPDMDVEVFQGVMEGLANHLDGLHTGISEYGEMKVEAEHELQQLNLEAMDSFGQNADW